MTPSCIGIIMDGNRRWAKTKGLPHVEGHRAGLETLKHAARFIGAKGVKHLIVYAFSTENWNRDPQEVSYLVTLFADTVRKELHELGTEGFRIRFVGERERFSPELQASMERLEKETDRHDVITLWVCLSYGGRSEIIAAAQKVIPEGEISEESFSKHLWTASMPDPDLIIRTGGEKRLSNFLPWQSIYSELFFTDTYWPDFSENEFNEILTEFFSRERRRGK